MSNDIPRRSRLDLFTPAETAIRAAEHAVEALPPDVRLTHAGNKLQEARALVADFVDGVPFGEGYPRPASAIPDAARTSPVSWCPTCVPINGGHTSACPKYQSAFDSPEVRAVDAAEERRAADSSTSPPTPKAEPWMEAIYSLVTKPCEVCGIRVEDEDRPDFKEPWLCYYCHCNDIGGRQNVKDHLNAASALLKAHDRDRRRRVADSSGSAPMPSPEPSGCPCTIVAPCTPHCTCANPVMSGGCRRCASYGSKEQRLAAATRLAALGSPDSSCADKPNGGRPAVQGCTHEPVCAEPQYPSARAAAPGSGAIPSDEKRVLDIFITSDAILTQRMRIAALLADVRRETVETCAKVCEGWDPLVRGPGKAIAERLRGLLITSTTPGKKT